MLDAWSISERGVPPGGDITDPVDVAGALYQTGGIAEQPACGRYSEPGEPSGVDHGAHPDDAAVGPHLAPIG